ncbi:MAG TPA: PKD domain-containing protein [Bryobacteraceae bacterium]|nr:PKD domain-containing protein [Bryobacteraceae bacterium]
MRFRNLVGVFALTLVLALASITPAAAQTLQAFNIERSIALNNILTGISPNLPANVLAALAGGALEVRETLIYNPQANTLTSTVFAVPTGSPIPTPPAVLANLGSALVAVVTMSVDKIYVTTKPFMSVMFVGTDTQSTTTPYGTYQGAASSISVGFTADTPPKVNTVIEAVAGAIVLYSPSATVNTLTVTTPPSGGGGGGGGNNGPTAVITPANQTVSIKEVTLDASQSTDPSGMALSYQWSVLGGANVSLLHGNSAVATAQLGDNGPQVYTFKVTVTDNAGLSATATTTITYIGH